jgi:hypothetical protein
MSGQSASASLLLIHFGRLRPQSKVGAGWDQVASLTRNIRPHLSKSLERNFTFLFNFFKLVAHVTQSCWRKRY